MTRRRWIVLGVVIATGLGVLLTQHTQVSSRPSRTTTATGDHTPGTIHLDALTSVIASGASISGSVVTQDNQSPIANAQVCVGCGNCEPLTAPPARCVIANTRGHYSVTDLPVGSYRVTAQAMGFEAGRSQPELVHVASNACSVQANITLRNGGAELAGVVLDAMGGTVPMARIRAVRLLPPAMTLEAEADADGRFSLLLPPGHLTLEASAAGYASARALVMAPSRSVELRLLAASAITGSVRTVDDKRAVSGIEVRAVLASNPYSPIHAAARTNAAGAFSIDNLEPGSYALIASGPGYFGTRTEPVTVELGSVQRDVNVLVERAVEVQGHVQTLEHGACSQGFVTLGPRGMEQWLDAAAQHNDGSNVRDDDRASVAGDAPVPMLMSMIGDDGTVSFDAVVPGRYFVNVQCFDHVRASGPSQLVVDQRPLRDIEWTVTAGLGLLVRIVDATGHAVPYASALLRFPEQQGRSALMPLMADANGHAELPGFLRPGRYQVESTPPQRGEVVSMELAEGTLRAEATLRLSGSSALRVRVEDQDGHAIDGVTVEAQRLDAAPDIAAQGIQTAGLMPAGAAAEGAFVGVPVGAGEYRLGPLVAGAFRVRVHDGLNMFEPMNASHVVLRDAAEYALAITLDRSAQITGEVVDDEGNPVADAWVSASTSGAAPVDGPVQTPTSARVLTDVDGRFVITHASPSVAFRLDAHARDVGSGTIDAVRAGTSRVRIRVSQKPDLANPAFADGPVATHPLTARLDR